jgi:uncharacterized membrane protein
MKILKFLSAILNDCITGIISIIAVPAIILILSYIIGWFSSLFGAVITNPKGEPAIALTGIIIISVVVVIAGLCVIGQSTFKYLKTKWNEIE